ncbi:class I SAM-dependent methyltransferase [Nocardiopsis sp. NPDC007018]|uniref:class I SAM-dependent methyltransferase n=1 Tax=Nocardiopsis sp. NPDC007018 TaxID=3155721 RepID=UPI0033CB4BCB
MSDGHGPVGSTNGSRRVPGRSEERPDAGDGAVAKRVRAVARQLPARGDRLLDVGCGDGEHTVALAGGYVRVDAIDTDPMLLDALGGRVAGTALEDRVGLHKMSPESLAFDTNTFDRVTAFDVIEHLDDLDGALAEIHRVLRPGGALSVTTSNRWFPFETHGVRWGGRRRSALTAPFLPWVRPLHGRMSDTRSFTSQELGRLLRGHGLRVRAIDYLMPTLGRVPSTARVSDALESTPLRVFGAGMAVTAVKPGL